MTPDGLESAIVCHPAHGTILVNWYAEEAANSNASMMEALQKSRDVAGRLNGTAVFEHCPADAKSSFDVWGEVGDTLRLMRNMKEQYDPTGTLNPGRFVGGM